MEVKVGQNALFSEFVGFLSRNCNALPCKSSLYRKTSSAISIYTPLCHAKLETVHSFLLIDKLPHTTSPLPKERSMHQGASCRAADTQQLAVPMVTSLSLTSVIFCLAVG